MGQIAKKYDYQFILGMSALLLTLGTIGTLAVK
jgi:hypothetical protein